MEENKRISKKDAARMLGVCEQSVANLVKRGALSSVRQGQMYYLNRDEVEALVPKTQGLRDVERAIREEELGAVRNLSNARIQRARRDFVQNIAGNISNWSRYSQLVLALYEAVVCSGMCDGELQPKEKEVLSAVLHFTPTEEIAEHFGLTYERIHQIYNRALRRVVRFSGRIRENYQGMMDEASGWKAYSNGLEKKISMLEGELKRLRQNNESGESLDEFLRSRLAENGLSARIVNGLRRAGIETVAELLHLRRKDLMRFRNLGKRSIAELDRFIERNGLEWEH